MRTPMSKDAGHTHLSEDASSTWEQNTTIGRAQERGNFATVIPLVYQPSTSTFPLPISGYTFG
jgi:hypothetical protein